MLLAGRARSMVRRGADVHCSPLHVADAGRGAIRLSWQGTEARREVNAAVYCLLLP